MYSSFYAAAQGAIGQQSRMDVISNNLANINNYGYKPKTGVFQDLMYYNLNNWQGDETRIQAGTGITLEKADTNFAPSGFDMTERDYDFAIINDGFFMMRNPVTNEITYTRNGRFSLSQRGDDFYLVNDAENLVLDRNRNPIRLVGDPATGLKLKRSPYSQGGAAVTGSLRVPGYGSGPGVGADDREPESVLLCTKDGPDLR